MRRIFIGLLIKILFVSFASAKTGDVIQRHIIPNYTALYSASSSFYEMSLASCDFDVLQHDQFLLEGVQGQHWFHQMHR